MSGAIHIKYLSIQATTELLQAQFFKIILQLHVWVAYSNATAMPFSSTDERHERTCSVGTSMQIQLSQP